MKKQKKQNSLSLNKFRIASIDNSMKSKIFGGTGTDNVTDTKGDGSKLCKSKEVDDNTMCIKDKGLEKPKP